MSKFKFVQWYGIVVCLLMAACTDVDITMPKGPKGDTGLSAYEFWKEKVADGTVDWPKDRTEVADFFKYLKGNDGKDGKSAFDQWKDMIADGSVDNPHNPGSKWPAGNNTVQDFWYFLTGATGESGQTPHIGDNGHWFVGNEDTGIAAQGEAGKDGANGKDAVPPTVTIGANDHWFVNGVDTGKKATGTNGKDGVSPTITIGNNGNWFVDGTDTGKKAVGADGKSPEVAIGENGNWYINGTDTGKPSFGKAGKDGTNGTNGTNGANGANGKSAYELWKEYIASGEVDNPHKPDQKWPADRNKQTDFWDFLTGRSSVIEIQVGKYNVIPDYWNSQLREYVIPTDGSVLFTVYDKTGKKVAAGVQVSGLPGVGATETFTTDDNGQFKVTWDKLPDNQPLSHRTGSVTVTVGGVQETSANNTLVPNRVNVRATVSTVYLSNASSDINSTRYANISFKFERQIDGKYSINSLVYWVTYVHNVVYSFYRSMIYCYINSTQRCAGSIVIDIIPTNGADKRKFFPFAPYFPVTNVIKRYFYPYFPAIIGIKGYSFPYFPYLSGIMKIKTALYSLFSRLDWHKTVVFPCLGEIYEGIRSLSWEIPVT